MKPGYAGRRMISKRLRQSNLLRHPNYVKRRLLKSPKRLVKKNIFYNKKQWAKIQNISSESENEELDKLNQHNIPFNSTPNFSEPLSVGSDSESESSSEEEEPNESSELVPAVSASSLRDELEDSEDEENLSDETDEDDQPKKFWLFESSKTDTAIIVLNHPCQVVLSGCLQVRALSGSADVHGWHLSSDVSHQMDFVPVYSSKYYGHIMLETMKPEKLPKRVKLYEHLATKLHSVAADIFISNVISVATKDCVVVALSRLELSRPVRYATRMLTPSMFSSRPGPYDMQRLGFSLSPSKSHALSITDEHRELAQQVIHAIHYARSVSAIAPRIVVCGERCTGKSTFIKFLINSVLSSHACSELYHLDCDPGQSEFTPSSCISLTRINSPLLGPPITHMKTPTRCCFVGGPSVENTPDLYMKSITALLEYYEENVSSEPLFVNTMGWCRGLGISLLVDILRFSRPNLVIQMDSQESKLPALSFDFLLEESGWISRRDQVMEDHMNIEFKKVTVISPNETGKERPRINLLPALQRSLSSITYLGRVLKDRSGGEIALTEAEPKCVPWREVSLMLPCKGPLKQEDLLQVVNGSWVALCTVESSQTLGPSDPNLMTFAKASENFCIGFGLVRGIDYDEEVVLVLTPEPLSRLQLVNAFAVMGDSLPYSVYTSQCLDCPLPYVCQTPVASKGGLGIKVRQLRKTYLR